MPRDRRLYMTFPIDFWQHPKIAPLSDSAFRLYVQSIGWCGENGRSYWISRTARLALGGSRRAARQLETAGLWLADRVEGMEGHWIVKDGSWAVLLPSREKVPAELRSAVLERDGHRCVICGATEALQMDHIFPWSLGGETSFSNLQTLCAPCNQAKGAKV